MIWSSSEPERNQAEGGRESTASWRWKEFTGEPAVTSEPESGDGGERSPSPEDLEEMRDRAYQEGLEAGRRAGRMEAEEELRNAVAAAAAAQEKLEERRRERADRLDDEILAVALAVAREIVSRELDGDREAYAEFVRRALNRIPVDQPVTVRLHPRDLSLISTVSAEEAESVAISGGREIRWTADDDISPGGCIVEAPERIVDGTVEQCIERAYRMLTDD